MEELEIVKKYLEEVKGYKNIQNISYFHSLDDSVYYRIEESRPNFTVVSLFNIRDLELSKYKLRLLIQEEVER